MAINIENDVNLDNFKIQNAKLDKSVVFGYATDPTLAYEGMFYYNTADKSLRYYNGSAWKVIGTAGMGTWGSITGNIDDQIDLKNKFDNLSSQIATKTKTEWLQVVASGKKIATIKLNNIATDIYAPNTEVTLNGTLTTNPSFYAPISPGVAGYYLKSKGPGQPPEYVDIQGMMVFKGAVVNYSDLPATGSNGDTYNVTNPFTYLGKPYDGGTNCMWEGVSWVPMGTKSSVGQVVWQQIAGGGETLAKITIDGVTTIVELPPGTTVMRYCGTVPNWSMLPTSGMLNGDLWINSTSNTARVWNGPLARWDDVGSINITVDNVLSTTSMNPLTNKATTNAINLKQDKLPVSIKGKYLHVNNVSGVLEWTDALPTEYLKTVTTTNKTSATPGKITFLKQDGTNKEIKLGTKIGFNADEIYLEQLDADEIDYDVSATPSSGTVAFALKYKEDIANRQNAMPSAPDNTHYLSTMAVKTYVDSKITGLYRFKGSLNASQFATLVSGTLPAEAGDTYNVTEQVTWSGKTYPAGTNFAVVTPSPRVLDALAGTYDLSIYQLIANKVDAYRTTPDNTHYPSELLMYDRLSLKADQTDLDAEMTVRASADATLQTNIDTEATARQDADNTLQTNIDKKLTIPGLATSRVYSCAYDGLAVPQTDKVTLSFSMLSLDGNETSTTKYIELEPATGGLAGVMSPVDKVKLDRFDFMTDTDIDTIIGGW